MTRRRELNRAMVLSARLPVACWLALAQISAPVKADPPQPSAGPIDFARDVRPIFQSRCLGCHGPGKQKGGLRLDRRAFLT